ncbi:putative reverse transcriptase domain-containing protein, partial [Tanacetum coccineum]
MIVGMDWLSKRKFVIVCHEKVVRIPLEGDEILRDSWGTRRSTLKVHLKLVLESLRKEKLYAKFSKLRNWMIILRIGSIEHEEAFQTLKNNLCDALVLSLPDGVEDFVVYCDASNQGLGCVLMQSEAFKQENVILVGSVMDEAHASRLRWMIYPVVLADATESVRDAIRFEYYLASSSGWTKSPVLWAKIGEGSLIGPELVQEMTDKVVKCLGNANLHVSLNEIDKNLRFVEEPVEIMDHEVKSLKCSIIPLVKVRWNSKRGPEFTWEHED